MSVRFGVTVTPSPVVVDQRLGYKYQPQPATRGTKAMAIVSGGLGVTAWGWLHVLLGAVVVAAGVLVLAGRRWARAVGVVVCVLSALSALSFLESHPGWALTVLVVDVLIVVALTVHGSEIRAG